MFGIVVVELGDIVGFGNHCGKVDKNNSVLFFHIEYRVCSWGKTYSILRCSI